MKKILFFAIVLIAGLLITANFGETIGTVQPPASLVKYSDSNDTALDPNTSSWAVCKSWTAIPSAFNDLKICFYAYDPNDPNNDTFNATIYVADYGGNAMKVCTVDCTVGGSKMSHNPTTLAELNGGAIDPNYAWVDTTGTVTTDWKGGVSEYNDAGTNDTAYFVFDPMSAKAIWCKIDTRSNAYLEVYCVMYGY